MIFGVIGGSLQIPRLFAIVFLPAAFNAGGLKNKYIYPIFIFFLILYLYGLLSSLWTPSIERWIKAAAYYLVHMVYFLEICLFSRRTEKAISVLSWAWTLTVFLTSIVGVWEIITDTHLAMSVQEGDDYWNDNGLMVLHRFASVTFGNMNTYVTYLSMCFPFVCYSIYQSQDKLLRILGFVAMSVSIFIISNNSSRGGFLCLGISIAILLWYALRSGSKKGHFLFLLMAVIIAYVIIEWGDILLYGITYRSQQKSFTEDTARINLIQRAIRVAFDDYLGFGAGMGGGEIALHNTEKSNIFSAYHNLIFEFLGSWGLWVVVVLAFLFRLYRKGVKLRDKNRRIVIVVSLITFLPMSVIDSGYLECVHTWAYFSTLFVFVYYEQIRYSNQVVLQAS